MKFIIVKNFTDVDLDSSSAPELHLEVEGKSHSIINFRNLYFCETSNTLAGRSGQLRVEDVKCDDITMIVYKCLKPFLKDDESYMVIDDNDNVRKFLVATEKYYTGI